MMACNAPERLMGQQRQAGVALLTVLLVVAIATVLAVAMLRSQQLALRYAGGLFNQDQAWLYTQGAEDFVQALLRQDSRDDARRGNALDHPGELWAQPIPAYPVDGGLIRAQISDLQGRFNINRLWHDGAADTEAAAIFQRLLKNLGLPDNLGPAVTDWIDSDNEPTASDGAEEDYYTRLSPAYRIANQPLQDISELRLIKGFSPEVMQRLLPHVCALPAAATLNVNTAGSMLISALSPSMSSRAASELVTQRPAKGYASVDEFLGQPVFNGLDHQQKNSLRQQLDVRTHYFQLLADADIAGRHSILLAVLARDDSGTLKTIARDLSQKALSRNGLARNKNNDAPESAQAMPGLDTERNSP